MTVTICPSCDLVLTEPDDISSGSHAHQGFCIAAQREAVASLKAALERISARASEAPGYNTEGALYDCMEIADEALKKLVG